jgi:hypothetical protein
LALHEQYPETVSLPTSDFGRLTTDAGKDAKLASVSAGLSPISHSLLPARLQWDDSTSLP